MLKLKQIDLKNFEEEIKGHLAGNYLCRYHDIIFTGVVVSVRSEIKTNSKDKQHIIFIETPDHRLCRIAINMLHELHLIIEE